MTKLHCLTINISADKLGALHIYNCQSVSVIEIHWQAEPKDRDSVVNVSDKGMIWVDITCYASLCMPYILQRF